MDHPFRSAALGGFNRQDVLAYLEKSAKQAAETQRELQQRIDALEETRTRQEAELKELREKAGRLEREGEELRAQLRRAGDDLSASRAACAGKTSALEAAGRELKELRAETTRLEPDAEAYAALKDRLARMELESHRRAQAIQEEAEGQAETLRAQMEEWLRRVEREYAALRAQMESAVSQAAGQLEQAGRCLERAAGLVDGQEKELESMVRSCRPPAGEAPGAEKKEPALTGV